jgi:hypothetical protein
MAGHNHQVYDRYYEKFNAKKIPSLLIRHIAHTFLNNLELFSPLTCAILQMKNTVYKIMHGDVRNFSFLILMNIIILL